MATAISTQRREWDAPCLAAFAGHGDVCEDATRFVPLQSGHWFSIAMIALLAWSQLSFAQTAAEFHRTLTVTPAETVTLDVDVENGELQVSYGRDGEVSIAAFAKTSASAVIDDSFFPTLLGIEQSGNLVKIRARKLPDDEDRIKVLYRIDVPYRTALTSKVNRGKQVITGIMGPVNAVTNTGDIKAAYISGDLAAHAGSGNLDLEVVGGHVDAVTGSGNISGIRLPQGVSAETGDGDITLMVVGRTTAIIKNGTGRMNVGGARESLVGSTDHGNLVVKAIPHQDWQLSSVSGDIRVELPPSAKFELEASTKTGELQFDRDDITRPDAKVLQFHQEINGGGRRIAVHTDGGRIKVR
jgi:hypothetical protein